MIQSDLHHPKRSNKDLCHILKQLLLDDYASGNAMPDDDEARLLRTWWYADWGKYKETMFPDTSNCDFILGVKSTIRGADWLPDIAIDVEYLKALAGSFWIGVLSDMEALSYMF